MARKTFYDLSPELQAKECQELAAEYSKEAREFTDETDQFYGMAYDKTDLQMVAAKVYADARKVLDII